MARDGTGNSALSRVGGETRKSAIPCKAHNGLARVPSRAIAPVNDNGNWLAHVCEIATNWGRPSALAKGLSEPLDMSGARSMREEWHGGVWSVFSIVGFAFPLFCETRPWNRVWSTVAA